MVMLGDRKKRKSTRTDLGAKDTGGHQKETSDA
jgi:hypothetical protein